MISTKHDHNIIISILYSIFISKTDGLDALESKQSRLYKCGLSKGLCYSPDKRTAWKLHQRDQIRITVSISTSLQSLQIKKSHIFGFHLVMSDVIRTFIFLCLPSCGLHLSVLSWSHSGSLWYKYILRSPPAAEVQNLLKAASKSFKSTSKNMTKASLNQLCTTIPQFTFSSTPTLNPSNLPLCLSIGANNPSGLIP